MNTLLFHLFTLVSRPVKHIYFRLGHFVRNKYFLPISKIGSLPIRTTRGKCFIFIHILETFLTGISFLFCLIFSVPIYCGLKLSWKKYETNLADFRSQWFEKKNFFVWFWSSTFLFMWRYEKNMGGKTLALWERMWIKTTEWYTTSVTRLGDILEFGQLFKALGHN